MLHHRLIRRVAVAGAILMRCAVPSTATQQSTRDATPAATFMTKNDATMAAMMNAHHQGAIDMARAELRHGTNEQLRRIAQEIAAMHLTVGDPAPPSRAAPAIP